MPTCGCAAYGYELGLIDAARYAKLVHKERTILEESPRLEKIFRQLEGKGYSLAQLLCRPENSYASLLRDFPEVMQDHGADINFQIELNYKYAGYISRQTSDVAKLAHSENIKIPKGFNFNTVIGLRNEAQQKLSQANPANVGQASRISGVSPADISVLMIALIRKNASKVVPEIENLEYCPPC